MKKISEMEEKEMRKDKGISMKKVFALVFLVFGFAVFGVNVHTAEAQTGEADFYVINSSPHVVAPGETAVLTITLKNLGTSFAARVGASLDPDDLSPLDPIGAAKIQIPSAAEATEGSFFGTVGQEEEIVLTYNVSVKPTAAEKVYSVPVNLTWGFGTGKVSSQTLYVGVEVKKKAAEFAVINVSPDEFAPGELTTLKITLKNTGSNFAKKVSAELDSKDSSPLDAVGASKINAEKALILPGESFVISYPVNVKENTAEGVYTTALSLSWETYVSDSATLSIGTHVKGSIVPAVAGLALDPASVRGGAKNVKISVSLENAGKATAENMKAELVLKEPFTPAYSQSDASFVGRLEPNKQKTATFYVDIAENAAPMKYSIPLKLTYQDSKGKEFSVTKSVELLIEPKPYFEVTDARAEPAFPKPDERVRLYITIKNVGFENAEAVDLRVIRESGQPFTYDRRSDFIGLLKPDEAGTATLILDVDKEAVPKEYLLRLLVRATGDSEKADSNVYTQELKTKITVASGDKKAEEAGIRPVIAGLAVILGAVFVFWKLWRRKTS